MARYNVNRLGRFSAPDPLSGSVGNPQSPNRYTYTANNLVNVIVPSGQLPWSPYYLHRPMSNAFSNWDEFDLLMLKTTTTETGFLVNVHYPQDASLQQLLSDAATGDGVYGGY